MRPLPLLDNRRMKREARKALDEIGINIPRIDVSVARLSGGQRQAIAVARTVNGTPTSSCWTSRWRRWARRRVRRSSTSSPA